MAISATTSLLAAEPQPIALDWTATALVIIDMQRDFLEPGGFGETLGNDVSQLARAVAPCADVLRRRAGGGNSGGAYPRGTSARSVRRAAGQDRARRAEQADRRSRPDGTDPDPRRGRPRHHSRALSARRRDRDRQARQGRVLRHRARRYPAELRHREFAGVRRHHRGLRQHHGARGQRPRLPLRRAGGLLRLLFPRIPRDGPEHDQGPGRHLRLGQLDSAAVLEAMARDLATETSNQRTVGASQ